MPRFVFIHWLINHWTINHEKLLKLFEIHTTDFQFL